MSQFPNHYKKFISSEQILSRVAELSSEIDEWIAEDKESKRDILGVPVLRGGLYFFSDISRALSHSIDMSTVQSWAYNAEENTALPSGVSVKMSDLPVRGRRVLIVDDICDSGKTLKAIEERLMDRGAKEVRAVALIQRAGSEPTYQAHWVGFTHDGPEWFVGYGMDDGGKWRNLADIYIAE